MPYPAGRFPMPPPRCPQCEFSYRWDGKNCGHCHKPVPTRASWETFASLVRFDYAHPKRGQRKLILVACAFARRVAHLLPPGSETPLEILALTEQYADAMKPVTAASLRPLRAEILGRPAHFSHDTAARSALAAAHAGMTCEKGPDAVGTGFRGAAYHARAAAAWATFPPQAWNTFPLPRHLERFRPAENVRPDEAGLMHTRGGMQTLNAAAELDRVSAMYEVWRRDHERNEESAQCWVYRDVYGYPFDPPDFDPAWQTSTALALARQMYESHEFSAMPILADALQDAGCCDDEILGHCRNDGEHVRGCWAVDYVLGKA